eukprot:Nitzschia sp. Nitz4//scaffold42_size132992//75442//76629//NITZ4_003401-RA/size132992-processed-gene-0.13-mRNA-1//1//CDS//3329551724//6249//frame0
MRFIDNLGLCVLGTTLLVVPSQGFCPVPGSALLASSLSSSASSSVIHAGSATALDELSSMTKISIESSDLDLVEKWAAKGVITHACTQPLWASQKGENGDKRYEDMVFNAIMYAKGKRGGGDSPLPDFDPNLNVAMDKLAVLLGSELLERIPGKVSTEIDVRLCEDTAGMVARAVQIVGMYRELGVDPENRVLIKLVGTWEGIQAAKILERKGIRTHVTGIYSYLQAAAAAQAGCYMLSPGPGHILDWYRSKGKKAGYHPTADPGVLLVQRIYSYLRKHGYPTICMPEGWSPSRGDGVQGSTLDEVLVLAGVDAMSLPLPILERLDQRPASEIERQMVPELSAAICSDPDFVLDEDTYKVYWATNTCGFESLQQDIRGATERVLELRETMINKYG